MVNASRRKIDEQRRLAAALGHYINSGAFLLTRRYDKIENLNADLKTTSNSKTAEDMLYD